MREVSYAILISLWGKALNSLFYLLYLCLERIFLSPRASRNDDANGNVVKCVVVDDDDAVKFAEARAFGE